jgi:hypothetical protein
MEMLGILCLFCCLVVPLLRLKLFSSYCTCRWMVNDFTRRQCALYEFTINYDVKTIASDSCGVQESHTGFAYLDCSVETPLLLMFLVILYILT